MLARCLTVCQGKVKFLVLDFFCSKDLMRLKVTKYWEYCCKIKLKVANWKVNYELKLK